MRIRLRDIRTDLDGFAQIASLAAQTERLSFAAIEIDMSAVGWLDANMCAPLGAVLYRMGRGPNTVALTGMRRDVDLILSKNGFLTNYGREARRDTFGTTIAYLRLEPGDSRFFGEYIEEQLLGKGLPEMSEGLVRKFRESIFEIYSNAAIHSRTRHGIYSCGQLYPRKHRLDFTVADLGVGIRANVNEHTGLNLTAAQAIQWATEGRNTTKSDRIPGGLGLKLLREFISMNEGLIQIASDAGYWMLEDNKTQAMTLPQPFPGTAVSIQVNTADERSYCLASEAAPSEVF